MKEIKIILSIVFSISLIYGYIEDSTGITMRDGVKLGTDLYFPMTSFPPWPTLLQRTPYDREWDEVYIVLITDVFGYALAVQNVRGYGDSEGEPMVFLTDGWGELQDGFDSIEWIADQIWSDGKVGMIGASAHGMTQYYAAGAEPPHLVCCAPMVAAPSLYHHCAYVGGEFRKGLIEAWLEGVETPWLIDTVANHPKYDSIWYAVNLKEKYDVSNYPMFHISGWFDIYTDGQLEAFSELQKRFHNQKLFIGPWGHGEAWGKREQGDLVFPPNAEMDELSFIEMLLEWYDYWIKDGGGPVPEPKVKFYLMGDCDTEDTTNWNKWVVADTWPLPDIQYKTFYIRENFLLDTVPPIMHEIDTFIYNPADPCSTYGGREFIGIPNEKYGPVDQTPIEGRSDVLCYTTPPLESPLTVIGKLMFVLYAASDRYDTDWVVKVTDVYPDGRSILITDNILKARFRHGFEQEDSLIPNIPDTFIIDLWSTAYVFNTGHRIRVLITSSNYPRFEKNPNTGAPFKRNDSTFVIAEQKIYKTPEMPSHLLLPVLPQPVNVLYPPDRYKYKTKEKHIVFTQIPLSNEIKISIEHNLPLSISVFDISGRKRAIKRTKIMSPGEYTVRLNSFKKGVYFVKIKTENKEFIKKIVILK